MSYHIHQTKAFVLDSGNSGEANRFFYLFTEELGTIDATAQGIRLVNSKLRMSLRNFSCVSVSLVRGKGGWRLTNAAHDYSLYDECKEDKEKILLVANIFSLLRRLLHGEEQNVQLFSLVKEAMDYVRKTPLTSEQIRNAECVLVLAILHKLGYVGKETEFGKFLTAPDWGEELLAEMGLVRRSVLTEINRSLKESQL